MESARINGCEVRTYSRTAKKCRNCQYSEYCRVKRIEAATAMITFNPPRIAHPETATYGAAEVAARLSAAAAAAGVSIEDFNRAYRRTVGKQGARSYD